MKIALVLYKYSELSGGVEGYVAGLARGLLDRGHEVHLFAHRFEPAAPAHLACHPVPATTLTSALKTLTFARNAAAMLKADHGFDIINGFGRTIYQDVFRLGSGVHWEYLIRSKPAMKNALYRALQRLNPRNAAIAHLERQTYSPAGHRMIVCNSEMGKKELQAYYEVADDHLCVIYNGVDGERFHPRNRENWREEMRPQWRAKSEELLGLFVGHGTVRKGIDTAITCLARMAGKVPMRLAVVGPCGPKFQAQAEQLRAPITFLGPQEKVERFYAAADFFFFPTRYEGFANVCLEAMASGLPLLTTRSSGLAEVIEDGREGLIVADPDAAEEMCTKLEALQDAELRRSLGAAARTRAEQFSPSRNLDEVEAVYQQVLEQKRAG